MTSKRLRIHGTVQGVGFRAWMIDAAQHLGVAGWVRNRGDGSVEALVEGETSAVEELLRACRRGPPAAAVTLIHEDLVEAEELIGFVARPAAP